MLMKHEMTLEQMYSEMLKACAFIKNKEYPEAISIMDGILSHDLNSELRSEALSFRASISEEQGDFQNAKQTLLEARSFSEEGGYGRYTIELGLGGVSEQLGLMDEATSWYYNALLTCARGVNTSGGTALKHFLKLKNEDRLTGQERVLCAQVVEKSWKLLRLDGEPDLSNLRMTAEALIQAQGKPIR